MDKKALKTLKNIHRKIVKLAEFMYVDTQSKEIDELCQLAEYVMSLIELEEANDGWISVKDRLPEEDGDYLISYILDGKPGVACANYADGIFYRQIGSPFPYRNVTAWQPSPEPYKGEKQ